MREGRRVVCSAKGRIERGKTWRWEIPVATCTSNKFNG